MNRLQSERNVLQFVRMNVKAFTGLLFVFISFMALAQIEDRSTRMAEVLKNNKVAAWGKRQEQQAKLYCGLTRKEILKCSVVVESVDLNLVYEELDGPQAQELSDLLKEFGVAPQGKKAHQIAEILCRTSKKAPKQPINCQVLPQFE